MSSAGLLAPSFRILFHALKRFSKRTLSSIDQKRVSDPVIVEADRISVKPQLFSSAFYSSIPISLARLLQQTLSPESIRVSWIEKFLADTHRATEKRLTHCPCLAYCPILLETENPSQVRVSLGASD